MTLKENAIIIKTVEKTGKTVQEAVDQALSDWSVKIERIEYEVLEQPSKGILGFGSKPAKVKVVLLAVEPLEAAKEFLQSVFDVLKIEPIIEIANITEIDKDNNAEKVKNKESALINLKGSSLGMLIGKHGQTLDALQYLTNIIANKEAANKRVKIVLDVENYRKRREETLMRLASRLADKVKHRREKVVLEPMNPQERKVIHMALQSDTRIMTYSEGDEPFRRVVIALRR
jgi:spoIIIJ-associated protein